jgi:hypothetical protein
VSQDGTHTIEFDASPCASLGGNRDAGFSCIHADFQLKIADGQTGHLEGKIIFDKEKSASPAKWLALVAALVGVGCLAAVVVVRRVSSRARDIQE